MEYITYPKLPTELSSAGRGSNLGCEFFTSMTHVCSAFKTAVENTMKLIDDWKAAAAATTAAARPSVHTGW